MQGILKCVIATIGAAALAAPALAQQGGPPPGAQGRPGGAPPPGAQGAPPAGAPGGGPGGAQGAGPPRARPAPPPPNTGIALSAEMAGRGSGYAGVVIDPPAGTVCYILNATLADPPTMAHIHGPDDRPVVTLANPADGASGGCMPIAADLAQKILASPQSYYVNVHTAAQPQGAIRGTLSR